MSKFDAIKKLFTSSLGKDEVALIYLGYSGARASNVGFESKLPTPTDEPS